MAELIGPGGRVDVSDRAARELGRVSGNAGAALATQETLALVLDALLLVQQRIAELNLDVEVNADEINLNTNDLEALTTAVRDRLVEIRDRLPAEDGTWDYAAGDDGQVDVPAGARVLGIAAIATDPGATVAIDGGDPIPVPESIGVELAPRGNLVAPQIVFAGTASFVVEWVT